MKLFTAILFWLAEAFWFWAIFCQGTPSNSGVLGDYVLIFLIVTACTFIAYRILRRLLLIGSKISQWSDN